MNVLVADCEVWWLNLKLLPHNITPNGFKHAMKRELEIIPLCYTKCYCYRLHHYSTTFKTKHITNFFFVFHFFIDNCGFSVRICFSSLHHSCVGSPRHIILCTFASLLSCLVKRRCCFDCEFIFALISFSQNC